MVQPDEIKTSVILDRWQHERLKVMLPYGQQTRVIKALLEMFMLAIKTEGRYVIQDVIDGKARIIRTNAVQNLNNVRDN